MDRLNLLKNALSEGKIQIMDDAEFANHKLDDFVAEYGACTFGLIKNKIERVIKMSQEERVAIEQAPDKEKRPEQVLDMFESMDKTQLTQDIEPVDAKLQQLEAAERFVFFGSTEFDNVKKSLRSVNEANKLIAENGRLASKKTYEMMQAAYEKVVRDCQKYIARKEKKGEIQEGKLQVEETSKTGKRIVAVQSVLEFCKNKIASLENSINPRRIDKVAANIKKAKDNVLAQGMMEGLDPKLAGDIMKEMNALSSNENATTKEQMYAAKQIRTIFKYMQENNIKPADCGLNKQDLTNAQQTVKIGRIAYAHEHPEVLQQNHEVLEAPQIHDENVML